MVLAACTNNTTPQPTPQTTNPDVSMPDFFHGEISLLQAKEDQTYRVILKIKPDENVTGAQIEWFFQDGVELVDGKQKWSGDLDKTKEMIFEITVKTNGEAEKEVRAWVHSDSPGSFTTNYRINLPKK